MNINFGNFDPVQIQGTIERAVGFDLNTLWQLSFGYKGLPFPANVLDSNIPGLSGTGRAPDKMNLYSAAGMPLYEKVNGRLMFMPVWLDDHLLPITRMGISRRKIINETAITGKSGTVKELIRADDYQITIQGIAFGHDKVWPEEEITTVKDLSEANRSLTIRSALTDTILGSNDYVVITEIKMPPARSEHVQPWEIKLLSDESFDLIID